MRTRTAGILMSLLICLALAGTAAADGVERVPPLKDAQTAKECGSCHMAFQPALLPAASWKALMAKLADHFGEDATLSAEKRAAIEQVLVRGAAREVRGEAPLRITELRWWKHEHGAGEVDPRRWKDPAVKSKVNCPACHSRAEQGDYDDDDREEGMEHERRERREHEEHERREHEEHERREHGDRDDD